MFSINTQRLAAVDGRGRRAISRRGFGRLPSRRAGGENGHLPRGAARCRAASCLLAWSFREQGSATVGYLVNGKERLRLSEVKIDGKHLEIRMPGYETRLTADAAGDQLHGEVYLDKLGGKDQHIPLQATWGEGFRFFANPASTYADVAGRWAVTLVDDSGASESRRRRVCPVRGHRHRHLPDADRRSTLSRRSGAGRRAVPVYLRRRACVSVQGEIDRGRHPGRRLLVRAQVSREMDREARCGRRSAGCLPTHRHAYRHAGVRFRLPGSCRQHGHLQGPAVPRQGAHRRARRQLVSELSRRSGISRAAVQGISRQGFGNRFLDVRAFRRLSSAPPPPRSASARITASNTPP